MNNDTQYNSTTPTATSPFFVTNPAQLSDAPAVPAPDPNAALRDARRALDAALAAAQLRAKTQPHRYARLAGNLATARDYLGWITRRHHTGSAS
jgi:hypothetical protein